MIHSWPCLRGRDCTWVSRKRARCDECTRLLALVLILRLCYKRQDGPSSCASTTNVVRSRVARNGSSSLPRAGRTFVDACTWRNSALYELCEHHSLVFYMSTYVLPNAPKLPDQVVRIKVLPIWINTLRSKKYP